MRQNKNQRGLLRSNWSLLGKDFMLNSNGEQKIKPQQKISQSSTRKLLSLLSCFWLLTFASPAGAQGNKLGVIKSPENLRQWRGITNRLRSMAVDYCVIDVSSTTNNVEDVDLAPVKILFLPNVETLSNNQVTALQKWMSKGGKVIVSGPTGSLSAPQVRTQLRSLLGAYWGFPLVSPSHLEPLQVRQQDWVKQKGLEATVRGGVIIPAGLSSRTAAVWQNEGSQPAVVVTEQSTFLGWRWGVDTASAAEVDAAWLNAAIRRYGSLPARNQTTAGACNPARESSAPTPTPPPEEEKQTTIEQSEPVQATNPQPTTRQPQTPPSTTVLAANRSSVNPPPAAPPQAINNARLSPQVESMHEELTSLIGRFESALLLAAAGDVNLDINSGSRSHQALQQAKQGLANFLSLAEQQNYQAARQEWFQARRTLWDNYPTENSLAQPETRAIWLDRGTIVKAKSEEDLRAIFDRLAAAGINTVFFETVNASYSIYPSQVAPEQNPLTKGWDPLEAAVKLAHERGMELHAWVWIFAAANQRHNIVLEQPRDYLGPVLTRHPDWAMKDRRGRIFHTNSKKAFFDPSNPEVRRYLLSLLEEIVTKYEVDGVQFDYIRYPFQNPRANFAYGYSDNARRLFQAQTGVDPSKISPRDRTQWASWENFRIQQVDSFVAEASQMLRQKRSQLLISAAVFPLPQRERLIQIQQNWEHWAQQGHIDMIVPMTYAQNTRQLERITQPLFKQNAANATLLLPGIRLLNLPDNVALDQVQLLRNLPTGGYALFAAENFNSNLQDIFSRMHNTEAGAPQPLPHRQPFQAAAARYQALQQEWNYLLDNEQLSANEDSMTQWREQGDALASALKVLADEPSTRHFLQAKLALSTFEGHFYRFMAQQAKETPYQVEVWVNRLNTIDRLLRYGERLTMKD